MQHPLRRPRAFSQCPHDTAAAAHSMFASLLAVTKPEAASGLPGYPPAGSGTQLKGVGSVEGGAVAALPDASA
jgi:hypothetical protein